MLAIFSVYGLNAMSIAGADMGFWEGFYFACFLTGLLLSMLSLLGGMGHINWHFHLPHGAHVPHAPMHHGGGIGKAGTGTGSVPWWNAFSIMIFLSWFGATGYLLTRYGTLVASVVFVLSALCGLVGGALIFWFLAKVIMPLDKPLTAEETAVTGVVGHVSAAIRVGGTGEVLYEQMGARRSVPARSETGDAIQRGEEVFVVRYEKGVAYVRRWEDLLDLPEK